MQNVSIPRQGLWWQRVGRVKGIVPPILVKLMQTPVSAFGIVVLSSFALIAIAAPYLAPPDNWEQRYQIPRDGFAQMPKAPSVEAWKTFPPDWHLHPLGTTDGQYDIYYGIVWGARGAFRTALVIIALSMLIGLPLGILAGYFGGWLDEAIMRITDIMLIFPGIVWMITLLVILSQPINLFGMTIYVNRLTAATIALVTFNWLTYARLIRGDILAAKQKEYIQAARSQGASHRRIMIKHLLPNSIHPVFVFASLDVGNVVLTLAALSFLGLGPGVGFADWGQLISFTRPWITGVYGNPFEFWYVIVYPAAAITLFVLSWNLVGDALRDVTDPKLKGKVRK